MTAAVVSLEAALPPVTSEENNPPATRTYRTNTSFVAVHFDQDAKGRIVFLPYGATLQVLGPSSCLVEGFEVVFEHRNYHVFEIDVLERSTQISERSQAEQRGGCGVNDQETIWQPAIDVAL
jgi:hypothetical protein